MNIIKDKTGVYVELPKDSIKFESKEAEIMYDLTIENDRLQQELQRKDNNWNELKEWLSDDKNYTSIQGCDVFYPSEILDKIKELESK